MLTGLVESIRAAYVNVWYWLRRHVFPVMPSEVVQENDLWREWQHVNCRCMYEIESESMTLDSTKELINKYDNNENVPGERRTSKTETVHKRRQLMREKHKLVDDLLAETDDKLYLSDIEKEHIHYLIDKFPDFNLLHRKAKKEAIILAFIWYVYKIKHPKRQLSEFKFSKDYGLSNPVFELIMCRIVQQLLAETPIIPKFTVKYDNDILCRTGLR